MKTPSLFWVLTFFLSLQFGMADDDYSKAGRTIEQTQKAGYLNTDRWIELLYKNIKK